MASNSGKVRGFYDQKKIGQTREERWQDRTYVLKKFHNDIKRQLISFCSKHAEKHLDIACGRGGDLDKWLDAKIKHVDGVDISPQEIEFAKERRAIVMGRRNPNFAPEYNFTARDDVTTGHIEWDAAYNSVSCMFSAHFFFESEAHFRHFLDNSARALVDGGLFYGTVTSGERISQLLGHEAVYSSDLLRIVRTWSEPAAVFGAGYTFSLAQTVTEGHEVRDGCMEFLVDFSVFTALCAEYHLFPIPDLAWPRGAVPLFQRPDQAHRNSPFRHFEPHFPEGPDRSELERASRLFAAFIFRKDLHAECVAGCRVHAPKPQRVAKAEPSRDAALADASGTGPTPADGTGAGPASEDWD